VDAIQIEDDEVVVITIGVMGIEQLLPDANERSKEKTIRDKEYISSCM
jgi:hypothetical protein